MREQKFVVAYVIGGLNGTQAARAAGYSDGNSCACKVRAHYLLRQDRVCEAINEVAWEKFKGEYRPSHKQHQTAGIEATRTKMRERAKRARMALKALEELGIEP